MKQSQQQQFVHMSESCQHKVYDALLNWLKSRGWSKHCLATVKMILSEHIIEFTKSPTRVRVGLALVDNILAGELVAHSSDFPRDAHGRLTTEPIWSELLSV
tara:strand:+ start:728 stop:1033 length:306 start_codon:yes stop_codon:yes gene_type:complete